MKVLLVLTALSLIAILAAVGALLWRLRWHLRRPDAVPPRPALEAQAVTEREPVEKV
jgi:hypothetical protein